MIVDDSDLRDRFRERDAVPGTVDDALFAHIIARLDAPEARPRFRFPLIGWAVPGLAATAIVIALGVAFNPWPRSYEVPQRIETVRIDRMPTAPPQPPEAIKINALHTSATSRTGEPPAAPSGSLAGIGLARTASIGLDVAQVTPALDAAQRIARAAGGAVTALQDAAPDTPGAARSATLTIVVPAAKLDATTNALAALGTVRSRSADAEALGGSIVDDAARLRNLRNEEADLLRIMHRSGSVADILDVEGKLSDVRGEIEQREGELADLKHRVATASIDVTLNEQEPVAPVRVPTFGDRIAAAWNASSAASAALGLAIVTVAVGAIAFAPYLLGIGAAISLWWWWRRRRDGW